MSMSEPNFAELPLELPKPKKLKPKSTHNNLPKTDNGTTRGRPRGAVNKIQLDVRALAQPHGPPAITKLVWLMHHAESQQMQGWAANAILDRAYGKPLQAVEQRNETIIYVAEMPPVPASSADWLREYAPHKVIEHEPSGSTDGRAQEHSPEDKP